MAQVLVMEDDLAVAEEISQMLADEGHVGDITRSASDARSALSSDRFDALITDILVLEDGRVQSDGGISLIGWVRKPTSKSAATDLRNLPIVTISGATTARGQRHLLQIAESVGADVTMKKPISADNICRVVAEFAGPSKG